MAVFSLQEVKALQVKNVADEDFQSWPESNNYGYICAGDSGGVSPVVYSTIRRLDFSNESVSDPGNNLPTRINGLAATSNDSYGYCGGGSFPFPLVYYNTINRLDFSNEVISSPGNNLLTAATALSAVSSNSYGYYVGGFVPGSPNIINNIMRLDFSNETTSDPGKNLPVSVYSTNSVSNSSYGYVGGGFSPTTVNTIQRLDFSTENVSLPGKNLLYSAGAYIGFSGISYGYFGGGYSPFRSTITRLDFSNETVSDTGKNAPVGNISRTGSVTSNSYSYICGSLNPPRSTITRLDFSTENLSTPGNFPGTIGGIGALSGGKSIYRSKGFKTYGYFGGGYSTPGTPPGDFINTISRLDFSNETVSNPGKNLSQKRNYMGTFSSNSYGYFCAGGGPSIPPFTEFGAYSTIERLDFSNELISLPGKNSTSGFLGRIKNMGSCSSNNYGYFGGGYYSTFINTISRLDFSTENVSNPGNNLPTSRHLLSSVSSSSYGYFCGGSTPNPAPPPFFVYVCTITRLDFSNETLSDPGKNLPVAVGNNSAVLNNSYGYFAGGYSPSITNLIIRLDFSNETASNPGKNLPLTLSAQGATSSNYYGYFGGGYRPPLIRPNTITRLDFYTENVSNPGNNLPSGRVGPRAVSNSN